MVHFCCKFLKFLGFYWVKRDGETIFGILFFWFGNFLLKFPFRDPAPRSSTVFPPDPNVDGLLDRAGVNYKWPVQLGKCSRGSRGHPEVDFSGFHVGLFWLEGILPPKTWGVQGMQKIWVIFLNFQGKVFGVGNVMTPCLFALLHPPKFGRSVDAFASAFSMAIATRERVASSATWSTKNPSWSWTRCEEKILKLFWCVFLSLCEGSAKSWKSLSRILQRFSVVKKSCFQRRHCQRIWSAKKTDKTHWILNQE